jgi:hypothetical protein
MRIVICFTQASLFLATLLAARADPEALVVPLGREAPHHLNILVLGNGLNESVGVRLQQAADEEFNYYRPAASGESVRPSGRLFEARAWHGVLLCIQPGDADPATYAAQLRELIDVLQSRQLALAWSSVIDTAGDIAAVRFNDAARQVMRDAGVMVADVRGALLPLSGRAYDASGRLSVAAVNAVADTLNAAVRNAVLRNSTPWAVLPAGETRDPAKLLANSSLMSNPAQLSLAPGKTTMVYRAEEGGWQFNLHSFLAHHEGRFWAIWSSGRVDEDGPSQIIRYSTSVDGYEWSESGVLAADPDGPEGPLRWMASGIYEDDGRLYALGSRNSGIERGMFWADAKLVRFVWENGNWREDQVIADDCVVYFPPLKVNGRDFHVWRNSQGHFATAVAKPSDAGWEVTKIPGPFPDYRLSETSHYVDADGIVHLIIRDQGGSRFLYHAVSYDGGGTWTIPVKTNFPDAISKNFSGRLSNGWFYLINNPRQDRPHERDPLTITFSNDGWSFGHPFALRRNAPPLRYSGKAKGSQSFQYSHAIEHDAKLWVIYATNKEDIEVTSFDVTAFGLPPIQP